MKTCVLCVLYITDISTSLHADIMEEDESFNTSDVMTEDVVSPAEEDPLPRIDEEDSHSLGSEVNLISSSS